MPRPKKVRKMADQGIAKTLWLRFGTVRDAEREAARDLVSLSVLTEEALRREVERRREARRILEVA